MTFLDLKNSSLSFIVSLANPSTLGVISGIKIGRGMTEVVENPAQVMHQSNPPAPSSPPGYCGAFAHLVSPGGGAFAYFALPGGRAFANPWAILELLTRTQFPIRI